MPIGEAAIENQQGAFWKKDALEAKKEYEAKRKVSGKKYKMVKISNLPPTWVEVEVTSKEQELIE